MAAVRERSLLIVFAVCVFVLPATAQPLDADVQLRLQRTLDSMRSTYGIPGISAGVVLPGRDMWLGVAGGSHPGHPVSPDMLFGIGSNSKLFTAVAILRCAEDGLLHIDDSLHTWLPPRDHIDTAITIRQLLNHTSGLADVTAITGYPDSILSNPERLFTRDEALSWLGPPRFLAGTSWEYCNTNYILAGIIVEKAGGREFAQFLRESILAPLHLDNTALPPEEEIPGIIAHPWTNGVDISATSRNSLHSVAWCAGAMYSTVSDMLRWYSALMNGSVLMEHSFREMTTFVGSGNYGFGLSEQHIDGRVLWLHGGSIRGYSSHMLYDTESAAIVCVLTNATRAPAPLISRQLLGTVLNAMATSMMPVNEQTVKLDIYPNPAKDILHIRGDGAPLRIHDTLGRLMWKRQATGPVSIDISAWPRGVYLLRVGNVMQRWVRM
jgi:D-alanyl-D-alanine carboxypeptidase